MWERTTRHPMTPPRLAENQAFLGLNIATLLLYTGLSIVLFQLPFDDFQNVTICPVRLAQALPLESEGSFTNPEVMMKLYWGGASFLQVPVLFRKRGRGKGTGCGGRRSAPSGSAASMLIC